MSGVRIPAGAPKKKDFRHKTEVSFCFFENPGHLAASAVAAHGGEPIAFKSQLFARSAPKAGVRIPAGAPKKKDFRRKTGVSFLFLVFLRGDSNPERVGAFKKYAGGIFLAPRGAAACCKPARFCAAKALSPLEHQRKDGQTTVFFCIASSKATLKP